MITFAQTSAPGIVNTWTVPRRKETYGRLSGGASANINGSISRRCRGLDHDQP